MSAEDVVDAMVGQLWQGIVHEPGFLLRDWGGGQKCDVAVLFLFDAEERVSHIVKRGDLPPVWRSPKPRRSRRLNYDGDPFEATFDVVDWKVRNVYAWAAVAADLLPGYPHDKQFLVRFAAGLYEIAPNRSALDSPDPGGPSQ